MSIPSLGKTVLTMAGSTNPVVLISKIAISVGVSIISKMIMEEITADKKSKKKCQFWFQLDSNVIVSSLTYLNKHTPTEVYMAVSFFNVLMFFKGLKIFCVPGSSENI